MKKLLKEKIKIYRKMLKKKHHVSYKNLQRLKKLFKKKHLFSCKNLQRLMKLIKRKHLRLKKLFKRKHQFSCKNIQMVKQLFKIQHIFLSKKPYTMKNYQFKSYQIQKFKNLFLFKVLFKMLLKHKKFLFKFMKCNYIRLTLKMIKIQILVILMKSLNDHKQLNLLIMMKLMI